MSFVGARDQVNVDIEVMRRYYRMDENAVLDELIVQAALSTDDLALVAERTRALVLGIRQAQSGKGGIDALLNEFSLSTEEGIVLMCLAEALLRVPDQETCDALIRDKLALGDWSSHLGNSDSLFVNASAWGLLLAGRVVDCGPEQRRQQLSLLKRTVNRLGGSVIRASVRYAMKVMGTQFVMGINISNALSRAKVMEQKGYRYSYDMLGEGARTQQDADRYFESYSDAIENIGRAAAGHGPQKSPGISVKLSALHPHYMVAQRQRVLQELTPKLKTLALAARRFDIGFTVDAEEADRLELSLEVIEAVFVDEELSGWQGFGLAVQAYQKRASFVIDWAKNLSQSAGRKMMVRLVKGAYWDSEIKWTQEQGLKDYPVFTRKPSTDVCYQACAKKLLSYRDYLYPQFATHNAYTVATVLTLDRDGPCSQRQGYEFQRLHGMGEELYDQVLQSEGVACRIYAPVGEHADLLAYLVRRLLENGANSSFVNNIIDESIPVESLLQDPVALVSSWKDKRNPGIPLPFELYSGNALEAGTRENSMGLDFSDETLLSELSNRMESIWQTMKAVEHAGGEPVVNPANVHQLIGGLNYANTAGIERALTIVHEGWEAWRNKPVTERAALLRKLAVALEQHMDELLVLCTKEAGKTIADGVAEVREAVDFCRYYADRAEELFMQSNDGASELQSRGVILCISPWNFPIAIFVGQVVAALVTGNTVIAKPAEQTSLVALRVIKIMAEVGFPDSVIQLLVSPGKPVGELLVPDERVQGVMFTGSTDVGFWLNQQLAKRVDGNIPFIAETGGQNAMIVDSTALPEQVVDDVILSGFQSAGQRCSALRVLFLQEEVADNILGMLKGAMEELSIGDPALLCTDVGPVIDSKALKRLQDHVSTLNSNPKATLLHRCELPITCESGCFFAPHLIELDDLDVLEQEVFGPVVHVVRYKSEHLDAVVDQINRTGFGLTLGVHSRIESVVQRIAERAKVGNVYINRNMIGAIVGVQPFGGRGLSGTGPKAGGPHYLTRLVKAKESKELVYSQTAFQVENNSEPRFSLGGLENLEQLNLPKLKGFSVERFKAIQSAGCGCLSFSKRLPGPTGESNLLITEARGSVMVATATQETLIDDLHRVLLALLAGNEVDWCVAPFDGDERLAVQAALRSALRSPSLQLLGQNQLNDSLLKKDLSAVILSPKMPWLNSIKQQLARREGALVALVDEQDVSLLSLRLQVEKTIAIDTTAAGGNASLMTMDAG